MLTGKVPIIQERYDMRTFNPNPKLCNEGTDIKSSSRYYGSQDLKPLNIKSEHNVNF